MILAVHFHQDRILPEGWVSWPTRDRIGVSYHKLTKQALEEEWDTDVTVVQDDVQGTFPPAEGFTVYGYQRGNHVCPRGFAADPPTWYLLFDAWREKPKSLCGSFTMLARGMEVLNTCR